MKLGVPVVLVLLPVAWFLLTRRLQHAGRLALPAVGAWTAPERRVLVVFAATALLWMTRTEPLGGWSGLLDMPGVGDSTVALGAVVALFLVPSGAAPGDRLLDWQTAARIPWGLLLLFAGGIAIARAFESSGLAQTLGDWLAHDLGITAGPCSWPSSGSPWW